MILRNFIYQLLSEGSVNVEANVLSFNKKDEEDTIGLLRQYYHEDILEMPLAAPAFDEAAALWAAKYFYIAVCLTVLRDEDAAVINEKLIVYKGEISPSVVFSVDLVFRYLPALLHLAKGLAPADTLVTAITGTLAQWPFSSVGSELTDIENEEIIFTDTSLKIAYLDRLILARDAKRIVSSQLQGEVFSAAGIHLDTIWPKAGLLLKNNY